MSFLQKIKTDFRGRVFNTFRRERLRLLAFVTTTYSNILLQLKGVGVGKKNRFIGCPYFYRHPESKIEIGDNCTFRSDKTSNLVGVNRPCLISTANAEAQIIIGNEVGMTGTVIGAAEKITIGNKVLCGANVLITDWDWHYLDIDKRHISGGESSPVVIEDNVWLGINTVVLKGVTIGKNSIIGANSLVTKSIPANVIAGGNPCKVIKGL